MPTPIGRSQAGCRKVLSRTTSAGGAHHDGAASAKDTALPVAGSMYRNISELATSETRN
jgi:hypothetical protein